METTHTLQKPVKSRRALQQRNKTIAPGVFLALGIALALAMIIVGCGGGSSTPVSPPATPVQPLQGADVQNIVQATVNSVNVDMTVAIVDRAGFVLGVFRTQNPPATATGNFRQVQYGSQRPVPSARPAPFFSIAPTP